MASTLLYVHRIFRGTGFGLELEKGGKINLKKEHRIKKESNIQFSS